MNEPHTFTPYEFREYVSYSEFTAWQICPAKHEHAYILNTEPMHRPAALPFGSAIHGALAAQYECLRKGNQLQPKGAFLDDFRARWGKEQDEPGPILFDKDTTTDSYTDLGITMLSDFYDEAKMPTKVIAVEYGFTAPLVDPATQGVLPKKLKGYIDLIARYGDNEDAAAIVEHKTASKAFDDDRLRFDPQLAAYQMAVRADLQIKEPRLAYQVILKNAKPPKKKKDDEPWQRVRWYEVARSEAQEREFVAQLVAMMRTVGAGVVWKNRGWQCKDCAYRYKCEV